MLKLGLLIQFVMFTACTSTSTSVRLDDTNAIITQDWRFIDLGVFGSLWGGASYWHCKTKPQSVCYQMLRTSPPKLNQDAEVESTIKGEMPRFLQGDLRGVEIENSSKFERLSDYGEFTVKGLVLPDGSELSYTRYVRKADGQKLDYWNSKYVSKTKEKRGAYRLLHEINEPSPNEWRLTAD
jgi:hypothetical protein